MPADSQPPQSSVAPNRLVAGALCIVGAAAAFAGMSACIQLAAESLNNATIVFLRNALALVILLPIVMLAAKRRQQPLRQFLATQRPSLHLMRGAIGLIAMYGFFYTIPRLSLPEAMLLTYSAPLFLPFIGAVWLQERLQVMTLAAACIGFVGIAVILQPDERLLMDVLDNAALLGLVAGFLAAVAMATIRKMANTEPMLRIVAWFLFFSTAVSAVPMLWAWSPPTVNGWLFMLATAGLASLGQLLITRGYQLAPAGRVSIFSYSTVVFAALYAAVLGRSLPGLWFWLGFGLVLLAGVLIMLVRERAP